MTTDVVQLYDKAGNFVAEVTITLDDDGCYPNIVRALGMTFSLVTGRYVQAAISEGKPYQRPA